MLTVLAVVGVIIVLVFGSLAAMLWNQQERIVFQPPGPPHPAARDARRIEFSAEDGQPLYALLVGEQAAAQGLVLVFHGNADLAVWQVSWAHEVVRRTGRAVLLAEYRGYGGLEGNPSYTGGRLDARAAYAVARDSLGVLPDRIVLFGHSLGSAIATELAKEIAAPEALLLVAPLTSIREMARRVSSAAIPLYWLRLVRVHYDTEAIVRSLETPVWVAHGTHDRVVPVEMGRRVFAAARHKGELLIVDRADHNGLVEAAGERYWTWLTRAVPPRVD